MIANLTRQLYLLSLAFVLLAAAGPADSWAQVTSESFNSLDANPPPGTYVSGSYTGDNGAVWSYVNLRTEANGITGESAELRKNNGLLTTTIPVAFDRLEFDYRTINGAARPDGAAVRVLIGGQSFGEYRSLRAAQGGVVGQVYTARIDNINAPAGTVLRIEAFGFEGTVLDNLRWGGFTGPVAVTGVEVTPASATIQEGGAVQLAAALQPSNAATQGVTWATSDASVATVDAGGLVSGLSPGQVTITATTDDGGFTDRAAVTVQALPPGGVDLPIGADGFTVATPSADSRRIYVSDSAGDDANDGLSEATPVKTLARGFSLVRDGFPDFVYLRRGDTWTDQTFADLKNRAGRSGTERIVVTAYGPGTARPLVKVDNETVLANTNTRNSNNDHLAIIGIEFYNYTANPNDPDFVDPGKGGVQVAFRFIGVTIVDLLFEDCKFSFFNDHAAFFNSAAGRGDVFRNVEFRRNILVDAYQRGSTDEKILSNGMFVSHAADFLLEENFFDHNGWNEALPDAQPNQFNHNVYFSKDNAGPMIVRGNFVSRASAHGVQLRSGGTAESNALVGNAVGMNMGFNDPPAFYNGPTRVTDNVVTDGRPQIVGDASDPQTGAVWGLWKQQITNLTVSNNIVANIEVATFGNRVPYKDMTANEFGSGNIAWNWTRDQVPADDPGFVDPSRDKDSYAAALGYADYEAFVTAAANRTAGTFPAEFAAENYVNYIKAGFMISQPLPVSLTSFSATAAGRVVELTWATASEVDNAGFDVQRAGDGSSWVTIAEVDGAGTSATATDYAYTDAAPLAGANYYRLRQRDLDGTATLTDVAVAYLPDGTSALRVYPSPARDYLVVDGLATSSLEGASGAVSVTLTDVSGRVMSMPEPTGSAGAGTLRLNLAGVPAGVYAVSVRAGNVVRTQRVVVE